MPSLLLRDGADADSDDGDGVSRTYTWMFAAISMALPMPYDPWCKPYMKKKKRMNFGPLTDGKQLQTGL